MSSTKKKEKTPEGIALGERVERRRVALGYTQAALANRVGMSQQGIVSILGGDVQRPGKLKELAEALRTTQDWLLDGVGEEELVEEPFQEIDAKLIQVPLISWVSAGRLLNSDSQVPYHNVPLLVFADLGPGDFFATRVQGDSMDRISPDGSIVIVNRRERTPEPGKPFLFAYDGEMTYKLWQPDPPRLEPHSLNTLNKTIFIKRKRDLEIIGRVRRTVLDL